MRQTAMGIFVNGIPVRPEQGQRRVFEARPSSAILATKAITPLAAPLSAIWPHHPDAPSHHGTAIGHRNWTQQLRTAALRSRAPGKAAPGPRAAMAGVPQTPFPMILVSRRSLYPD